jgi:thiamine-monophosphate kinase
MLTVKDLGEHRLLDKLQRFCAPNLVGDDAALLDFPANKQLVVTTDMLVENVHFSDRTTPPLAVGWRAAAANLSDLAAMGAMPIGITVGLSLRGNVTLDWIETVYQGLKQCLDQFSTPIIGGDITRSEVNTLAITALGQVSPQQTILRHVAQPQDVIVITGEHGLAKAGLELLLNPQLYPSVSDETQVKLISAHQYPQPRLDVIQQLQQLEFNSPIAGMDSSDGLADALLQICRFSGVGAKINLEAIPLHPSLLDLTDPATALEWCLYGGEDFELVICLPSSLAQELIANLNSQAVIIGQITQSSGIKFVNLPPNYRKLSLTERKTYQHF